MVSTCRQGHPVSGDALVCGVCGQDLRPRCAQGHRSPPGAVFCETCGQPLAPADFGPATADIPILDYSAPSFAESILSAGVATPGAPGPPAPGAPESATLCDPDAGLATAAPVAGADRATLARERSGLRGIAGDRHGLDIGAASAPPEASAQANRVSEGGAGLPAVATGAPDLADTLPPGVRRSTHASPVPAGNGPPPAPPEPSRLAPIPDWPAPSRSRTGPKVVAAFSALAVLAAGAFFLLRPGPHPRHADAGPVAGTAPAPGLSPAQRAAVAGWTAPAPIRPLPRRAILTGLSCPRPGECAAVDDEGDVFWSSSPGAWRIVASDPHRQLVAISCAAAGSCLALDSSGGVMIDSRGTWTGPAYVDDRQGAFTAVSCAAPAFCMAVDSAGNAFAYHGPGRAWTPFTVDSLGSGFVSVSCPAPSFCLAADTGGGVFAFNGTSWSASPAAIDVGHAFAAVSCATPAFCAAVDRDGNAAVFRDGKWAVTRIGAIADAIACPVSGRCLAADISGGVLTFARGGWSPPVRIDHRVALTALSCPAQRACVTAVRAGNVLYRTLPP